jgi:hypothetical protein
VSFDRSYVSITFTNTYITAFNCLPDADDTARTALALHAMRKNVDLSAMIAAFEGGFHFLTYKGERNPSFSTNCNVAAALLAQEDPSLYTIQIQKCIQFLTTHAFKREIKDKWVKLAANPNFVN